MSFPLSEAHHTDQVVPNGFCVLRMRNDADAPVSDMTLHLAPTIEFCGYGQKKSRCPTIERIPADSPEKARERAL